MPILSFKEFTVNEDQTANLIQQKNSLSQQINDLQKKLLDVQQQIVVAQKQTLAQNPQTQIPMQEAIENNSIPRDAEIVSAEYDFSNKELDLRIMNGSEREYWQANVEDFEEFLKGYVEGEFDRDELRRYVSKEEEGTGPDDYVSFNYLNLEDFWNDTDQRTKIRIISDYLRTKNAL